MSLASLALPCAPAPEAKAVRPRSIASHLALLCVAVAIPILTCVSAVLWRYADAEKHKLEDRGILSVREISEVLDIDISSLEAILRTLATSTRVQTREYATFYANAREVTRQTNLPVILSDAQGHAILDTSQPFGATLPDLDDAVRRAAAGGEAGVTDLYRTPEAQYAIVAPVFHRDTGEITHLLHFSIGAHRVRDILLRSIGAQNVRTSVIDRTGRILTRSLNNETA